MRNCLQPMRFAALSLAIAGLTTIAGTTGRAADPAEDRFESKVRPVLAEHCVKCHGPDKQSSGLRLDSRDAMLKGGDTEGPSLVPGNPDGSPLIKALRHDGELKMPPKSKLPDPVVAELTEWVRGGAPWPQGSVISAAKQEDASKKHWSFQPVRKVNPPAAIAGYPSSSAIDAFLNAALAKQGLKPAPHADRRTLIRRATFDLTGLPPKPEDVEAFLADRRPDKVVFAELVDHLLASPHYGERWGRLWLDVARYADTKGYVFAEDRNYPFAYTYRDWVVEALNRDLPYDQFVTEQIAADKLPHAPDNRSLAALGFLTVGRRFLQDPNEIIDDRIDLVSRGLLGLSVACARCHDHKFDPIPAEDYYSLYGVFASTDEPKELPLIASPGNPSGDIKGSPKYEHEMSERRKALQSFQAAKRTELEAELKLRIGEYLVAAEKLDFNPRSPRLAEVARESKLRPELIRRVSARWRDRLNADDPKLAPWKAVAGVQEAVFRDQATSLIKGTKAKPSPAPPALVRALTALPLGSRREMAQCYGEILTRAANSTDKNLDELRTWLEAPESLIKIPDGDLARVLAKPDRDRLRGLEKKIAELDAADPGAPARAMVLVDRPQPVEPHVFIRGNPGRPGKQVPRRFLKLISGPERPAFKDGSGRLELARAIVSPENPLTARVIVNRVWSGHFGQGIVRTPSDFGLRGDPPTHPELLDWLASTFVENHWSLKSLHRAIMLSDAYQRRSDITPEGFKTDPQNLLLARQNRRRLDFESMRDSLLLVSGRLDATIGGKSVPLENPPFSTRRTLYGYIDRYNLEPVYRTFDFPNPDSSSPKRATTIVPQQALYLLNSPFVIEQSRSLASHLAETASTSEERVKELYREVFDRAPSPSELKLGLSFLGRPPRVADEGPRSAWQYGTAGPAAPVKPDSKALKTQFKPFPHWTGKGWQLEDKIPTADGNFASVHAGGGHPGPVGNWAATLRWTAPADLSISISGTLNHPAKDGDGVRARIVSSRLGLLGSWDAKTSKVATDLENLSVRAGDTVDFLVDCQNEPSFDSYSWNPSIRLAGGSPPESSASKGLRQTSWNAMNEFHGPEPAPLSTLETYVQAILLSNEFLYVD